MNSVIVTPHLGRARSKEFQKLRADLISDFTGKRAAQIRLRPAGRVALEWAKLEVGEAVPAQALAQVCEVTWQLRGQAQGRQVQSAKVGLTVNQGLFGHGSCVILER